MSLLEPLRLGTRTAPNRVVFGPHETNLGRARSFSERHVAYYERRAAGGAGVIVTEEASVHPSDWPYERCPLATDCAEGWRQIVDACRAASPDIVVVAALGHSGGQGSSAYSQSPIWAPSRVPEVNTREVPKWMEAGDIDTVVAGFGDAAAIAVDAGCDGVEVNAGQHSLIRQFLSGLTNQRADGWGDDKTKLLRDVLVAVRASIGDAVVALRLSCDELAPWAGVTPEMAARIAVEVAPLVDLITVVRGAIFSVGATRPDGHTPPGFNLDLCRQIRAAVDGAVPVVAQGSIVDVGQAAWAIGDGVCDAVEMTRAQIADADLVAKLATDRSDRIRPCLLCNQTCQVRDARNPIVTCVLDPRSGHETIDPPIVERHGGSREVVVVGGGPAGLEAARVAALRGHSVTVLEATDRIGGAVRAAAEGAGRDRLALAVDWLASECDALGVKVEIGRRVERDDLDDLLAEGVSVVLATGSVPGPLGYVVDDDAVFLRAVDVLEGVDVPPGVVLIWDPIGGPIGVSLAEKLRGEGRDVHLGTPDPIAGNELSRTGDLAPANQRMQSAGVVLERRSILRRVGAGEVAFDDRFTGAPRTLPIDVVIDAGHRLPDDTLWHEFGATLPLAGDAVAPRTILEAVLEGRRRALELDA